MDVSRRKRRQARCAHRVTISVQASGIERQVCEACGHVSVQFVSGLSGEVDRDRFARPTERGGKHERIETDEDPLVEVLAEPPSAPDRPWWEEPGRDG